MTKLICSLIVATAVVWSQQPNADEAHNPQKLVPPTEYHSIPKSVREFLEQRQCLLPEMKNYDKDHTLNVVSGHFVKADQTDWAALCVVNDRPKIVVLWGNTTGCSDEIRSGWPLDGLFSKEPAGGLYLMPVSAKQILEYRKFFGDEHTNDISHQGIEVGDDQASLIYYCDGKTWLELQGND